MKIYDHPLSHDSYARGQQEAGMNVWQVAAQRIKVDAPKTFATAMEDAKAGKVTPLALKVTGVAIGCALIGDGVNNIVKGYGEEVDDLMIRGDTVTSNHTRMFAGVAGLGMGAAALYLGLTKGMIR